MGFVTWVQLPLQLCLSIQGCVLKPICITFRVALTCHIACILFNKETMHMTLRPPHYVLISSSLCKHTQYRSRRLRNYRYEVLRERNWHVHMNNYIREEHKFSREFLLLTNTFRLQKHVVARLVKKVPRILGNQRFITVFTTAHFWPLSWFKWFQLAVSHLTPHTSSSPYQGLFKYAYLFRFPSQKPVHISSSHE